MEEREKRKQREVQMELERQLKEAEAVRETFIHNDHMQFKPRPTDFNVEKNRWHYKNSAMFTSSEI